MSPELRDLFISWLLLSFAFAWDLSPTRFLVTMPYYMAAVGTAFIFHELAHRGVARSLGYHSEYRMWPWGLLLAVFSAIVTRGRWIFAAPGAVYTYGVYNPRHEGMISLAGPLTNIAVALLLFPLLPLHPVFSYVYRVNVVLAAFNLLPLPALDGYKVARWSLSIWFLSFLLALVLGVL